ncbi:MAG: DEAD/DEAH box helicase [Candidatus Omnitrophota bacterium]
MFPAITIRNLPSIFNQFVLEKFLSANRIQWKFVTLCAVENGAEPSQEAHVLLNKHSEVHKAIQILNECEASDRLVKAAEADEAAVELLLAEQEEGQDDEKPSRKKRGKTVEEAPLPQEAGPAISEEDDEVDDLRVPFASLGLSPAILQRLEHLGFENAMPIQALAIPPAMEGCDLIGQARTGTGKTLAFAIPMVERFLSQSVRRLRGLVLAPTRELAIQIKEVFDSLIEGSHLRAVVVYGGDSIIDQTIELREGVDILIATPGRLLDMRERGRLRFDAAEIIVLDEADRMLDMGFLPQIAAVLGCFHDHPQTLLFSATIPSELNKLTGVTLRNPVLVEAGGGDLTPLNTVSQKVLYVSPEEKLRLLFDLLDQEEGPILVFAKTKRSTERLAQQLRSAGYHATRIHGDISQSDRLKAVESFRKGIYKILVATDVASRGLDIEGIAHVVNYDLPMAPEDHLHRIGRTARAGASGKATTFITHKERRTMKHFRTVLGQS